METFHEVKHSENKYTACTYSLNYFSRILRPSASSGFTIGRLSFTQLLTCVIWIPSLCTILAYRLPSDGVASPLGRLPTCRITGVLLWGAIGAVLLTYDDHLILFLFAVCSVGCIFIRSLVASFLISSILNFPLLV